MPFEEIVYGRTHAWRKTDKMWSQKLALSICMRWAKNETSRVLTSFFFDLARWPSFLHQVTHFQTWPRNHQGKHFEQDAWWLFKWYHKGKHSGIEEKLWPPEGEKGFKEIWPSDLAFDPTSPIFESNLEIIKRNILVKIYKDWSKTMVSTGWTRF